MNPNALMNVPTELLRANVPHGLPTGSMDAAGDRAWTVGACIVAGLLAALLFVVLR
jgi:hypothetical protein